MVISHSNPHCRLSMISVTNPPLLVFSCWNTRSRSRSSGVPFLSFSEYRRSLSLNSSVFLFLSSSLSRISAFFLSKYFCWCINNSRSREYPFWILLPFIQALVWPRGFWIMKSDFYRENIPGLLEENEQLSVTGDHQSESTGSESESDLVYFLFFKKI